MENKSKRLEFWEQPEQLSLIRFYARRFNSLKSIAKNMGVDRATLWRWQKDSPLIHGALINNRWVRAAEIEDLLYEKAKEGKLWAIIRYLRAFGGRSYNPNLFAPCDDCGIDLTAEILSEKQPEEKPKITKSLPDELEKVIYKYKTTT